MKRLAWHRMQWELARVAPRLGLPGAAALLLLLGAVAVWAALVVPARQDTERLASETTALERRARQAAGSTASPPQGVREQLAEFRSRFGDEKSISTSIARLQSVARRHGVQLDQAEFRLGGDAREPLARYSIVLPVKADYRAVRRFALEALQEMPGLALEELTLRRSDARAAQIEAQLRFVLFVSKVPA